MSATRDFLLERPHYLARAVLYAFGGFSLIILVLSWFATINITAIGKGIITTENDPKEVYTSANGVAIDVFVKKGQMVKKGQILATISSDDGAQTGSAIENSRVILSRAQDELSNLEHSAKVEIDGAKQNLTRAIEQEKLAENLYKEGFTTKIDYLKAKDALASARSNLEKAKNESARKINEAKTRVLSIKTDSEGQKRKALLSNARRGDSNASKDGLDALYAPCDGVVALGQSWGANMPIKSSSAAFVIVPSHEELVAKIEIPTSQMTNVAIGQKVQLKIDAYPFQQFGIWQGTLSYVSATSKSDAKGVSMYEANVKISKEELSKQSRTLVVGQSLQAEIVVERKRILIYLVDYIRGVAKRQ